MAVPIERPLGEESEVKWRQETALTWVHAPRNVLKLGSPEQTFPVQ